MSTRILSVAFRRGLCDACTKTPEPGAAVAVVTFAEPIFGKPDHETNYCRPCYESFARRIGATWA